MVAELSLIREQGYAVNRGENYEKLYGIGVAAPRNLGDVIGGFSVTGPAHAITGADQETELAGIVTDAVAEFELELSPA